ncbi:MAG: DUF4105 domain-containing protein [Sphaerochaeta sp.]|jgi:hypothetical protein|nr:DUF4105 domain-containing protein [Sphaerochaeta sp.]
MKRVALTAALLTLCLTLFAGTSHPVKPDTLADLGTIDLRPTLAPNQRQWAEGITITLLTIGSGDPLYAWFGHSALIVGQPNGASTMYDWGIFDFEQEHFYLNFARGRMYYYVWASDGAWRIDEALQEGRDVRLAELDLSAEAKWALAGYLSEHIGSEGATYLYHFYDDNCATRIRDIIDVATEGDFGRWAKSRSTAESARLLTAPYMLHRPLVSWVLSTLQGARVDRIESQWDAMFLPMELERAVLDYRRSDGSPLVKSLTTLAEDKSPKTTQRSATAMAVALSLSLTILLLLLPSAARKVVLGLLYLVLAIIGSLLLFMMCYSDMDMTWANINILVINPVLFIAAFALLFTRRRHSILATILALVTTLLLIGRVVWPSLFAQDNLTTLLVLLPLYLSGAAFERRGNRKAGKGAHAEAAGSESGRKA